MLLKTYSVQPHPAFASLGKASAHTQLIFGSQAAYTGVATVLYIWSQNPANMSKGSNNPDFKKNTHKDARVT